MEEFRFGRAWSLGYGLITGRALYHAALLIGLGIIAPMALQYSFLGTVVGSSSPGLTGMSGMGTGPVLGAAAMALMALSYVLQLGSCFGSWRCGLARNTSLGGALLYGLPAGLLAIAIVAVAVLVAGATFAQIMAQPGLALLLGIVAAAPVILVAALFYTLMSAVVAVAIAVTLILLIGIGAATGNIGMAATLVGGSGAIAVMLIALSAVWLWLASRLSCAASIMAERKSLNLFAAARDSWQLTWEEQWAILRYLALIGLGFAIVLLASIVAVGAGAAATFHFGVGLQTQRGAAILLGLFIAIPLSYLGVMIPAGIYRTLDSATDDAAVFA